MRNKHLMIRIIAILITGILLQMMIYFYEPKVGREIDSFKGVTVHYNGKEYEKCYGKHYSKDGYYYGEKWQCVEYVKRFYYEAKGHSMPDVMGNAKDFFDPAVRQGKLNHRRGLVQYRNGGDVKPQIDDLIVFTNTKYGHVAIITEVGTDWIEVIQQNVLGHPRQKLCLTVKNDHYYIGTTNRPAGWLRKEN